MVLDANLIEEFKNSSSIHGLSRFGGPELYSRRRYVKSNIFFLIYRNNQ
jgi:hypothetical protein